MYVDYMSTRPSLEFGVMIVSNRHVISKPFMDHYIYRIICIILIKIIVMLAGIVALKYK